MFGEIHPALRITVKMYNSVYIRVKLLRISYVLGARYSEKLRCVCEDVSVGQTYRPTAPVDVEKASLCVGAVDCMTWIAMKLPCFREDIAAGQTCVQLPRRR